jgi:hypothetical protein
MNTTIVEIKSVADLSDDPQDSNRSLPPTWAHWLLSLPGATEKRYVPRAPSGSVGLLLPQTKIVVKLRPFVLPLLRAAFGVWMLSEQGAHQPVAWLGWTATSLFEALTKLKDNVMRLAEDKGEACTYAAVVRAGSVTRQMNAFPDLENIWSSHQSVREGCSVVTCMHHDGSRCGAQRDQVLTIVDRLKAQGVLEGRDSGLWPTP